MPQGRIIDAGDDLLRVSGELVFATAADLLGQFDQLQVAGRELTIDLSSVGDCDSAGLALLLEWQERARRRGGRVRYLKLPEPLLGIARLSNAADLIALAD